MAVLCRKAPNFNFIYIETTPAIARQYNFRGVPYYRVYDSQGLLVAYGNHARDWIQKCLQRYDVQDEGHFRSLP